MRSLGIVLVISASTLACSKPSAGTTDGGPRDVAEPVASTLAYVPKAPPEPEPTAKELYDKLLKQHQESMRSAAVDGRYEDVCTGTPWVNATLCRWVAARAGGTAASRPSGEVFKAFFQKEHVKKVSGRNLTGESSDQIYEVSASGYRNHCMLDTIDTRYTSKGRFTMWVQEQPETREVTLSSGSTANWVVLEEAILATSLMSLAHSGSGIEGTATAKDTMFQIVTYQSYAQLKGDLVPIPGQQVPASPVAAAPTPTPVAVAAVPVPVPQAPSAPSPQKAAAAAVNKKPAVDRPACLKACITRCADEPSCERACVGKCP